MLNSWKILRISTRQLAPAALAVGLLGAASCSEVLEDVGDYFEGDEANVLAIEQANNDQDFPKLNEVPDKPRAASTSKDLDQLSEGLIADRDEASYTNETLRSRYVEVAPLLRETIVTGNEADPQFESTPHREAIQREKLWSAKATEQSYATDMERRVSRSLSSLAEERRIINIEPASEQVLRDRRTEIAENLRISSNDNRSTYADDSSLLDSRQNVLAQSVRKSETSYTGGRRDSRAVAAGQDRSRSGVLTISQFREMFNERFDSSGRTPHSKDKLKQAASQDHGNGLSIDRAVNSDSADLAQVDIDTYSLPSLSSRGDRSYSGQASVSFQAASIPFALGSASLNSSNRAALKEVVKLHRKFGGTVHVVGHASKRTRDMATESHRMINFNLSLDRATAVSLELSRLGVSAEAITVTARSDNEPIFHEYMPKGEAYNRRTEVYLIY
mgnify:CR=1 FL=1